MKVHAHRGPANTHHTSHGPSKSPKMRLFKRKGSKKDNSDNDQKSEFLPSELESSWEQAHLAYRGKGSPLPAETLRQMERAYKTDFSAVRVVTESRLAAGMGAWAFASGRQIHFAPGHFAPATQKGKELIGHELGHVVQQGADGRKTIQPNKSWHLNQNPRLEAEADQAGKWAAAPKKSPNSAPPLSAGAVAKGAVQGYFPRGLFTLADDMSIAVADATQTMYAKTGKADESNKMLSANNSKIELMETSKTKLFKGPRKEEPRREVTLTQILPKNKENGTSGKNMELWADCGRACQSVMGGSNKKAVTSGASGAQGSYLDGPVATRTQLMRDWFKDRLNTSTSESEKKAIEKTLLSTATLDAKIAKNAAELAILKAIPTPKTAELEQIEFKKLAGQQLESELSDLLWGYYAKLSKAEKLEIDRKLGINNFVAPKVGEGYMIVSSDYNSGYSSAYSSAYKSASFNFHFAGVVMESDNGDDRATLENFTVGDYAAKNNLWKFYMSGKVGTEENFHGSRKSEFGTNPTTFHEKGF